MDISELEKLLGELAQLQGQYKSEVPGARKAWPRSIKERVAKVAELGVSSAEIARQTKIPYYTIHGWAKSQSRKAPGKFREIAVVAARQAPAPPASVAESGTVTVTMPNGCKIEGLSSSAALAWLERISGSLR